MTHPIINMNDRLWGDDKNFETYVQELCGNPDAVSGGHEVEVYRLGRNENEPTDLYEAHIKLLNADGSVYAEFVAITQHDTPEQANESIKQLVLELGGSVEEFESGKMAREPFGNEVN